MRVPTRYRSDLQRSAQEYLSLRRRDARADNWIVILALALIMSVTLFLDGVFRRSADGGTVVDSGAIGVILLLCILAGVAIVKRAIHLRIRALQSKAGKLGFHLSGDSEGKGVTCYWSGQNFLFDPMNGSHYATR